MLEYEYSWLTKFIITQSSKTRPSRIRLGELHYDSEARVSDSAQGCPDRARLRVDSPESSLTRPSRLRVEPDPGSTLFARDSRL